MIAPLVVNSQINIPKMMLNGFEIDIVDTFKIKFKTFLFK